MTEDQIERHVEKMTDRLDKIYMNGEIDEEKYKEELNAIDNWSWMEYRRMGGAIFTSRDRAQDY